MPTGPIQVPDIVVTIEDADEFMAAFESAMSGLPLEPASRPLPVPRGEACACGFA